MNNSIAIISDIHGNYPAFNAVLKDIDNRGITDIFCLGDLVGYYCMVNEVINEVKERKIPCIMGNHDFALVYNKGIIERSKTCTRILSWQIEIITPKNLDFLKSLLSSFEFSLGGKRTYCTHGGLEDNVDEYLFEVSIDYLMKHKFLHDTLITGHTHLPSMKRFYNGQSWFNPGSIGQPRDGFPASSYLILNSNHSAEFIRVDYDVNAIIEIMKKYSFEEYIYKPLLTGKKIGYVSDTL